jgi:hypothetical protein
VSGDGARLVRAFEADLAAMAAGLEDRIGDIFADAVHTAAEAIIVGNQYGPGVPVDTGFLRASFDTSDLARARTQREVTLTTAAEYAVHLEAGERDGSALQRRSAEEQIKNLKGTQGPTPFVEPVEARWTAIVEDTVRRTGGDRAR